jgi:hypothetical protein
VHLVGREHLARGAQLGDGVQHTGDKQLLQGYQGLDLSDLNQGSQFDSSVTYGRNGDDLNGDLAGIGAKFDH